MSSLRATCPTCKSELEIDTALVGREVECGHCLKVFVATAPPAVTPAAPPATGAAAPADVPPCRRAAPYDDTLWDGRDLAAFFSFAFGLLGTGAMICFCPADQLLPWPVVALSVTAVVVGLYGRASKAAKWMAVGGIWLGVFALLGRLFVWLVLQSLAFGPGVGGIG